MNFLTFENLNSFAKKCKILDAFSIFFARYLPYLLFCFLIAVSFYYDFINIFLGALVAGCIGRLINEFVHIFYKIKRPAYLAKTKVLISFTKNFSFPSGHTSFFFGISFYFLFYFKVLGIILLLLSFLISIARVFCGVHWTKDILGGIFIGFISAFAINYFVINLWT
jgi:undecaprenyl-diphosphatase